MRARNLSAAVLAALLAWPLVAPAQPPGGHIAPTEPLSPEAERKAFRLPPGFEAQLVAVEPEINKPMNLAFDDRGRLWVTSTVEYPYPAPPGRKPRDSVKVLEDFGPDGRARKVTTFADGLNIPIGVLPLPGRKHAEAIVFSIPSIWLLRDTDGDGKADERRVLYTEYGQRDTHGLTSGFTIGFDGWIYACHGFSNTSTVKGGGKEAITMQSGNTYRIRADGSRIEQHTWGQVNPFGLALDPLGNLYSADCHSRPIYQLLRGGYYPSFGKPHDGLGFAPEMVTHSHGSTAIAGIVHYSAGQFPPQYRDTIFIGNVVTCRINHDRIDWKGSSPKGMAQPDFLASDDPWFRPVDLALGTDGALYVADFYNRIIGHYEVPLDHPGRDRERGRIWRIVYRGPDGKGPSPAPPEDRSRAPIETLIKDLESDNLAVRLLATHLLASRGEKEVTPALTALLEQPVAEQPRDGWRRVHALWALERLGTLSAGQLVEASMHPDRLVRVHAQRILGERADWPRHVENLVLPRLRDRDFHVQRAAAEALGRHPNPDFIPPLLGQLGRVPAGDTHLAHVVRMALRNQLFQKESWARLTPSPALADVALGVGSPEAADFLLEAVRSRQQPGLPVLRAVEHVARHGKDSTREQLRVLLQEESRDDLLRQAGLFRAFERGTQSGGHRVSREAQTWGEALTLRLFDSGKGAEVQAGAELVGVLRLEPLQQRLARLATDPRASEAVRTAALKALASLDARRHAAVLGTVLGDASAPIALREQAAALLGQANQEATRAQLMANLPTAPARLQTAIAQALVTGREGAALLLDAVQAGKASARLLLERAVNLRLAASGLPGVKEKLAKLTAGLPPVDAQAQQLLAKRRDGFRSASRDVAQGAKVFEKRCAICHQVSGKGARIGPQLDGIGARGLERLLEDILDPNRNVDQAFRLTTLGLKNGQVVSGLLLREEGQVLVMADQEGKEVRVPRASVDEQTTAQMSPMPAALESQIPEADFYHLLAYLLTQQTRPE